MTKSSDKRTAEDAEIDSVSAQLVHVRDVFRRAIVDVPNRLSNPEAARQFEDARQVLLDALYSYQEAIRRRHS